MRLTILDTATGERRTIESDYDARWWAEGNGACDCHRWEAFPEAEIDVDEDECAGMGRFLIVACDDLSGPPEESQPYTLFELNQSYPVDLVERSLPGARAARQRLEAEEREIAARVRLMGRGFVLP